MPIRNLLVVMLSTICLLACNNSETSATASPTSAESADSDPGKAGDSANEVTQSTLDTSPADAPAEEIVASSNKPYQIIDGNISANAIEGWKTYNGGGCGACHGKGAMGGVGPTLGESVTTTLSATDFKNIVINGKPGTMMRPNKTNKRVMDNLDNLYAYLVARGDGVLGPENLIKFPFGKNQ